MSVTKITQYPMDRQILNTRCKSVVKFNKSLKNLVQDLFDTLRSTTGVGLAAPQIGRTERVFVYEWEEYSGAIVNPELIAYDGEELGIEGCLSIQNMRGWVPRYSSLVMTGWDVNGKRVKLIANGYFARILQHELDHLNGVLFTEKIVAPPEGVEDNAIPQAPSNEE